MIDDILSHYRASCILFQRVVFDRCHGMVVLRHWEELHDSITIGT